MKYYVHCSNCRARMKRTGKKKVVNSDIDKKPIYEREYECPKCGRVANYNEDKNILS